MRAAGLVGGALLAAIACTSRAVPMNHVDLTDLGTRYATAWSSQDPALLASFYAGSKEHYDEAEYQRQLKTGASPTP